MYYNINWLKSKCLLNIFSSPQIIGVLKLKLIASRICVWEAISCQSIYLKHTIKLAYHIPSC